MTNKEYYLDDLIKIAIDDLGIIGVDKETNRPFNCTQFECDRCLFHDNEECYEECKEWLKSEHWEGMVKGLQEGDIVAVSFSNNDEDYLLRVFAEYDFENKRYVCFTDGCSVNKYNKCAWKFCKKLPNVKYQEDKVNE